MPAFSFFGSPVKFGFSLSDKNDFTPSTNLPISVRSKKRHDELVSLVPPSHQDGSIVYEYGSGSQVATANFEELSLLENELIVRYRDMALYAECDMAIDDIMNSMVVSEDNKPIVSLGLDELKISERIKDKMRAEFNTILKLLSFKMNYYELAKRWYVDGKMHHHIIIDPQNPRHGIQELRYIDPRQIRKIKGVHKIKDPMTGLDVVVDTNEFFLFNPLGILQPSSYTGIPISVDAISFAHSGIVSKNGDMILSHLHKAIRPVNQLKMMEDATVIYKLTRAPDRRVFYIDVGNLPTNRAERYVRDMMERFKNRLVYNAITGEAGDDRRYLAMQEDFWLPRREGGKGTQIDTLEGGQNFGDMTDVNYFLKNVYKALNIPISRLDPNNGFNLGRATEITRDEIDFSKFIKKLRNRFSMVFHSCMRVQLILKGITTEEGWNEIEDKINYVYNSDSYFSELKQSEIMQDRLTLLDKAESYIGRYFSHSYVRRNILMQTDDEINDIDAQIEREKTTGMFSVRSGKVIANLPNETEEDPPDAVDELPIDIESFTDGSNINEPSNNEILPITKYTISDPSYEGNAEMVKSIPAKRIIAGRVITLPQQN